MLFVSRYALFRLNKSDCFLRAAADTTNLAIDGIMGITSPDREINMYTKDPPSIVDVDTQLGIISGWYIERNKKGASLFLSLSGCLFWLRNMWLSNKKMRESIVFSKYSDGRDGRDAPTAADMKAAEALLKSVSKFALDQCSVSQVDITEIWKLYGIQ